MEHITDLPKIPKELEPLAEEAKKYSDFKEFSDDYSFNLMRGRYWHITDNPNFRLKKDYTPRDLSSMSASFTGLFPGLMISYTPEVWAEYFPDRKYAIEIRLPKAIKGKDYTIVNRGFGHEIFVNNVDKAEIIGGVISLKQAIKDSEKYNKIIPQSKEDLKSFWELAQEEHIH